MRAAKISRVVTVVAALLTVVVPTAVFSPHAQAQPEVCDGRDDDGDGTVDLDCPRTCADPRSAGSTRLVSGASVSATLGTDRSVVWNGQGYGATWSEAAGFDTQVFFARLDPSGAVLAPPLPINALGPIVSDPAISWSGAGYGITWVAEDFGLPEVFFAFVDAGGALSVGPVQVNTPDRDGQRPSIAWDGEAFVVAWAWYNARVHMRRITEAGVLLGTEACITCSDASGTGRVSLAVAGQTVGYAFSDGHGSIRLAESDLAGVPAGPAVTVVSDTGAGRPSLVWGPGHFAVTWYDRRNPGEELIYFNRVAPGRVLLGPETLISAGEYYAHDPYLSWTGQEYLLAWTGGASGGPYSLFLRRLDGSGTLLGPAASFAGSSRPYAREQLVWGGARPAVLQEEDQLLSPRPIRLRLLNCCADGDADGVDWCDGDTDDGEASSFPGAPEICDGLDNDLDGSLDEGCSGLCEAAPWVSAGLWPTGAIQPPSLAVRAASPQGFVAHRDPALPGSQLVLERGGPPWSASPVEQDEAASDQPTSAWTGQSIATVFRDFRGGEPGLQFSTHLADGTPVVNDVLVEAALAGLDTPTLAWLGRWLALTRESAEGSHLALLSDQGARITTPIKLASGGEVALAPAPGGAVVLLVLEPVASNHEVRLELRDHQGGLLLGPVVIAPPTQARRGPAVTATDSGFVLAWMENGLVVAATDSDLVTTTAPTPTATDLLMGGARPALAANGQEVLLAFTATRLSGPTRPYRLRLDSQAQPLGPAQPLGFDRQTGAVRLAWDGQAFWTGWTRSADGVPEVRVGKLDCLAGPEPSRVRWLRFENKSRLAWDPAEAADYDVISGDLAELRQNGTLTTAVDTCEAAGSPATTLDLPVRSLPAFYLVRARVGGSVGTWNPDGVSAPADRDSQVPAVCP